eukprot:NODE_126_length_18761_cov_0.476262.p1 type:complete len:1007 gc:universal NODE_126_length_18761_cov_0.476262:12610-15630(+)
MQYEHTHHFLRPFILQILKFRGCRFLKQHHLAFIYILMTKLAEGVFCIRNMLEHVSNKLRCSPMKLCEFIMHYNFQDFLYDLSKSSTDSTQYLTVCDKLNELDGSCCNHHQDVLNVLLPHLLDLLSRNELVIKIGSIKMISYLCFSKELQIPFILSNFTDLMLTYPSLDLEILSQVSSITSVSLLEQNIQQILKILHKSFGYRKHSTSPWGSKYPHKTGSTEACICDISNSLLCTLLSLNLCSSSDVFQIFHILKPNLSVDAQVLYLKSTPSTDLLDLTFDSQPAFFIYNKFFLNFNTSNLFDSCVLQFILPICNSNLPYSNTLLLLFQPMLTNPLYLNDLLQTSLNCSAPTLGVILFDILINVKEIDAFKRSITLLNALNPTTPHFINNFKLSFEGDLISINNYTVDSNTFNTIILRWLIDMLKSNHYSTIYSTFNVFQQLLATHHYFLLDHYAILLKTLLSIIFTSPFDSIPSNVSLYHQCLFTIDLFIPIHTICRFDKSQLDELVACYDTALKKWPSIAKSTIHSIDVLIHSCQSSMCRFLPSILETCVQIIGHVNTSVYVLEMLSSLSNVPNVYKNMNESDFKTIFGIAFQYICTPNYKQYDMYLAFSVVNTWLLHVRNAPFAFLLNRLEMALTSNPRVRDRLIICADYTSRLQLKAMTNVDVDVDSKSSEYYIHGHCLVTIVNDYVVVRRPSGTTVHSKEDILVDKLPCNMEFKTRSNSIFRKPSISLRNTNTIQQLLQAFPSECFINGNKRIQEFIYCQSASHLLVDELFSVQLQINEKLIRNVNVLDHTPTVDFHKYGMYYINTGQSEYEIFSNTSMPSDFMMIYRQFGELMPLDSKKLKYKGGLEYKVDGEEVMVWQDEITYMVFINSVMMPNDDNDRSRNNKKRHVGNCHVNIVFKERNAEYKPIKSQNVMAVILIEPWEYNNLYKISLIPNKNMPYIGPLHKHRIMAKEYVGVFTRQIAFHCNIYAQIYMKIMNDDSEYISDWRQRLMIIEKLTNK